MVKVLLVSALHIKEKLREASLLVLTYYKSLNIQNDCHGDKHSVNALYYYYFMKRSKNRKLMCYNLV